MSPSSADVKRSVFKGLQIRGDLNPSMISSITFEPTLGIAARRIDKLGTSIKSFKEPLMQSIREVMVKSIRMNFDTGGRPTWEPWSIDTVEIRDRLGIPVNRLLIRTGALRTAASQINIWRITPTQAIIADLPQKIWYGKIHQGGYEGNSMAARTKAFGGDRKKALAAMLAAQRKAISTGVAIGSTPVSAIPARPFLVIQPEDEDAITEIFIEWLGERVTAAWPGVRS